ncbi:unnamed protein product [Penicillium camemberti]|uniref:Str. FM013 n=1 Tax=Penicillium camemberti (strain FM 013) TaxID=1429867 RepID=A0A0G4PIZ4_PENC3|nr:unnamed protein product [Penicillium camemberti]
MIILNIVHAACEKVAGWEAGRGSRSVARRVPIFAPFQALGVLMDFQCMPCYLSPGFHGGDRWLRPGDWGA